MAKQEKYFLGPNLLRDIRRTVTRVESMPEGGGGFGQEPRLQELHRRGGAGARIRIGKTLSAISKESAGNVAFYDQDESTCVTECDPAEFSSAGETVCAQNLIEDIPADAWVYVVRPQGSESWHIIGRGVTDDEEDETDTDICGRVDAPAVTLQFSACHGTAAAATAVVLGDCPGPIDSVTVTNGGSGYAVVARVEPEITITGSGRGATFTPTFTKVDGECDIPTWRINTVSVEGGEGYSDDEALNVRGDTQTVIVECPELTLAADEEGYPTSVNVIDGGEMYKEDENGEHYVATVTITVTQLPPSAGTGAKFTAVVEDDPSNTSAFGSIVSVTVDEPGDNYVNEVATYPLRAQGFWFSKLPDYDGSKTQLLGHADNGCLKWFDVTACGTAVATGVCCDGQTADIAITSETACTDASKTWIPDADADDLPGPCCGVEE